MTDRLLSFVQHPFGRRIARALHLPQPARLQRRMDATSDRELAGRSVLTIAPGSVGPMPSLLAAITALGGGAAGDAPIQTLAVDATGCRDIAALRALFEQAQFAVTRLAMNARVLALTSAATGDAAEAACAQAVNGFVRALAKEIGRRGATANVLVLQEGAASAESLAGALRFFGTDRSAYVSGQVLAWRKTPEAVTNETMTHETTGRAPRSRVALVTGAAGGIGMATARRLALDGLRVLCVDVPAARQPLEALAADIGGALLAADLTASDAVDELIDAIRRLGGLDVLVHNAGITRDRTLARMAPADWDAVMAVNLTAILTIDARLEAVGLLNDGAREICLSSISGIAGNAGQTNYSATKAALIGYVAARAMALDARGGTINAIAPGFIETAMTRRMPLMVREAGRRLNSLKQGGTPEDVAEAIAFLAAPGARPLTGQVLRVCGQSLLGA